MLQSIETANLSSTAPVEPPLPELTKRGSLHVMTRRALAVTAICCALIVIGVGMGGTQFEGGTLGNIGFLCFLVGLTGGAVFLIVALITAAMSIPERRTLTRIASGDYLWAKRLSPDQQREVRRARADELTSRAADTRKVAIFVSVAVVLLVAIPGIFDPELELLPTLLITAASMAALLAFLSGVARLIAWLSGRELLLAGSFNHVVISADGLVVEPEYWGWRQTGRRLASARVRGGKNPSLEFVFNVRVNSQVADQHQFIVPIDAEDVDTADLIVRQLNQGIDQ